MLENLCEFTVYSSIFFPISEPFHCCAFFLFLIEGPLVVLLPRVAVTRGKGEGNQAAQGGRGHLHNIPFIHRTKQTSTASLLWLEVCSMGRGRNKWGVGGVAEKIQTLPELQCCGGIWFASTQEESEDQKWFRKARPPGMEGGGRSMGCGAVCS